MIAMNVHSSAQLERERLCIVRDGPLCTDGRKAGGGSNVYTTVRLGGRLEEGHSTITALFVRVTSRSSLQQESRIFYPKQHMC